MDQALKETKFYKDAEAGMNLFTGKDLPEKNKLVSKFCLDHKLIAEERLGEVQGIGESIQKKIIELVTTGKLLYYEELKAATPPGLVAMLDSGQFNAKALATTVVPIEGMREAYEQVAYRTTVTAIMTP